MNLKPGDILNNGSVYRKVEFDINATGAQAIIDKMQAEIDELRASPKRRSEMLRSKIGEAMGFASLCWDPRPSGVFDSRLAAEHLDALMKELEGDK